MTLLTKRKFEDLANQHDDYCISIYIPTARTGDNKDSRIRLKNRLKSIENDLKAMGVKPKELNKILSPVSEIIADTNFWRHLSDALVMFRSRTDFYYTTLPLDVEELSVVSDSYHLLPLLSSFNNNDTFFILELSMNNNRLFRATQNEIEEIETQGFPDNMAESTGKDVKQKSLQFRTGQTSGGTGLYHGKGEGKDEKKTEITKYLTEVDQGLCDILEGFSAPLIVASVEYIFSIFREVSSYDHIYPKAVLGNYDHGDILLVHEKACELLVPYFNEIRNTQKQVYSEKIGKTTSEVTEIVNASMAGSVDTLFVKKHNQLWGKVRTDSGSIEIHEEKKSHDTCLLDFSARSTFLKGGKVFLEEPEELPEPTEAANAILRY